VKKVTTKKMDLMGGPTAPGQFRSGTTVHNVKPFYAFVLIPWLVREEDPIPMTDSYVCVVRRM
jgi:hypothetical protein